MASEICKTPYVCARDFDINNFNVDKLDHKSRYRGRLKAIGYPYYTYPDGNKDILYIKTGKIKSSVYYPEFIMDYKHCHILFTSEQACIDIKNIITAIDAKHNYKREENKEYLKKISNFIRELGEEKNLKENRIKKKY